MKRLRITHRTSGARRRAAKLAAVAAGLIALCAFTAVPALAGHKPHSDRPGGERTKAGGAVTNLATPGLVNFRRGALFSCFGAVGGTNVPGSTATITRGLFTVNATVHLVGLKNTFYTVELVTSGCQTLGFGFVTTNASGVANTMVTANRGFLNDAFAYALGGGDLQVTPDATF
jgi:hypothetical protein